VLDVARAIQGAAVMGFVSSGLPGPKGNRETFVWLAEPGRPGALPDLDAVEFGETWDEGPSGGERSETI